MKKKSSGLTIAGRIIAYGGVILCAAALITVFVLYKQPVASVVDIIDRLIPLKYGPFGADKRMDNLLFWGGALAALFLVVGVILIVCGRKKTAAGEVVAEATEAAAQTASQDKFLAKAQEVLPEGVYNVVDKAYTFTKKNAKIVAGSAAALVSLGVVGKLSKKKSKSKKKGK